MSGGNIKNFRNFLAGAVFLPVMANGSLSAAPAHHQSPLEPVDARSIAVLDVSYDDTLPAARTLGARMYMDEDGTGSIGCDVLVQGSFDVGASYCEGAKTGNRAYLQPDGYGKANQFFATLSGLDPSEEVNVVIVSRGGTPYEASPILNPQRGLTPEEMTGTLAREIQASSAVSIPEGGGAQVPGAGLEIYAVDVLCDADSPCGEDGFDPRVRIMAYSPESAESIDLEMRTGDAAYVGRARVAVEKLLQIPEGSLRTYIGTPDGRWVPAFYADGGEEYLVGVFEGQDGNVATVSSQDVRVPDGYDIGGESSSSICTRIPVDLSLKQDTESPLEATGPADQVPCIQFTPHHWDMPLFVGLPAEGESWKTGFYAGDRIYLVGKYEGIRREPEQGLDYVTLSGVEFAMPGNWFPNPSIDRWWKGDAAHGLCLRVPINLAKSHDGNLFAWPDIETVACSDDNYSAPQK